jgi:hypothetical protein
MGFCPEGVWVMGYCGLMGYGVQFPAHRGGGPKNVWDFRGYGLWQAWVMRGTSGLAPLRASGPSEANYLSGGNWPERGLPKR